MLYRAQTTRSHTNKKNAEIRSEKGRNRDRWISVVCVLFALEWMTFQQQAWTAEIPIGRTYRVRISIKSMHPITINTTISTAVTFQQRFNSRCRLFDSHFCVVSRLATANIFERSFTKTSLLYRVAAHCLQSFSVVHNMCEWKRDSTTKANICYASSATVFISIGFGVALGDWTIDRLIMKF